MVWRGGTPKPITPTIASREIDATIGTIPLVRAMVQADPRLQLPTSAELPCSDHTPVHNEDQNFIPNYLLFLLQFIWAQRTDWFFGVDMGIYHTTGGSPSVPVVPDGFLSLGVERRKQGRSRSSYVIWEEQGVVPVLALEVVSKTAGDEYRAKALIYANLGVPYYVVYNPDYWQRDRQQPFVVFRLGTDGYQLQAGEPVWLPEVGLGIGRSRYQFGAVDREVLSWFNQQGDRYLTPEEQLAQYKQRFGEVDA